MSHDDDLTTNPTCNPHINELIDQRLQDPVRRELLRGGLGLASLSFIGGCSSLSGSPAESHSRPAALGYAAVSKSLADAVTVPSGYSVTVLYRLGDPIATGVSAYANDGTDAAASFDRRAGDHHDGMHYFGLGASGAYSAMSSERGLLCINHEAITPPFLHPNGVTVTGKDASQMRTAPDEVLREFYVHGVSVVEVGKAGSGAWRYRQDSSFNRRIHTLSEMIMAGPAAGSAQMVTRFSPDGTRTRGTVNNCANGYTPWGTYLTCEENYAGYFRRVAANDNPRRSAKEQAALSRNGIAGNGRELWATVTPDTADSLYGRWIAEVRGATAADDYRNVANTYGWVVEIDPFAPKSTPKKRTAMGRFAHEGAWPARAVAGRPLVYYMGDDSRGEYVYKYVSSAQWDPSDAERGLVAGDKYLDSGKLYVAQFNADGTGSWIELSRSNPPVAASAVYAFADAADVLINARLAADAVGATKMDRPEWGAVDPVTGAVYMTLTNNNAASRSLAATDAPNPRHYNDPRTNGTAQRGNPNGHIIRWQEPSPEALTLNWDIYLFGARATADAGNVNLSGLTADNDFSSPDGIWFSPATNLCWIETDDGAYTDVTNCMLLAALPGRVGDGAAKTVTNTDAAGASRQVQTFVGAAAGTKVRRFLVGPKECEITGLAETPDGRTLFVNIQHPGEDTAPNFTTSTYGSHWPDGGRARPRSATIVITKDDGGRIGV